MAPEVIACDKDPNADYDVKVGGVDSSAPPFFWPRTLTAASLVLAMR